VPFYAKRLDLTLASLGSTLEQVERIGGFQTVTLVLNVLLTFLSVMQFAIIARAILSWFDPGARWPISQILLQITEPIIAPIRRVMPRTGFIDFSPLVALLLIYLLRMMLVNAVS
jgi:YggT family protein